MQRNGISDTRIILIDGIQIGGLLTISETGFDEDPVEVPENGYIRLIGSGVKKLKQIELAYLVKRESPTLKYFLDWKKAGGYARELTQYFTDKSGDVTNAYRRDSHGSCELGSFVSPAFDEATRQKAMFTITLFPYTYEPKLLV